VIHEVVPLHPQHFKQFFHLTSADRQRIALENLLFLFAAEELYPAKNGKHYSKSLITASVIGLKMAFSMLVGLGRSIRSTGAKVNTMPMTKSPAKAASSRHIFSRTSQGASKAIISPKNIIKPKITVTHHLCLSPVTCHLSPVT
jgi:hypothetical protein